MVTEILARIDGENFFAGIVLWNDVVIEAAPIVAFMKKQRWSRDKVRDYCNQKNWKVTVVWQHYRREHAEDR